MPKCIISTVGQILQAQCKVASIGVIGSADGPTAIYVATAVRLAYIVAAVAALVVAGIVIFVIAKRGREDE